MRARIPSVVHFPFGYQVKVKQGSQAELDKVLGVKADGGWRVDLQTLYLLKTLDRSRKLRIFAHELVHALNDWTHWLLDQT